MCIELKWPNILSDFFLGLLFLSLPAGLREVHYSQAENRFFAPQGQLVAPIYMKPGMADGLMGPLGCTKFHLNWRRGGNAAPKYEKFLLFGK